MQAAVVAERPSIPPRLLVAVALATGLLIGLMLAASPPRGVALLLAVGYVPLAFFNLPVALLAWIPLVFIMRLGLFAFAPLGALLIMGLAWFGTLRRQTESDGGAAKSVQLPFLALILVFELWLLMTTLWAEAPAEVINDAPNWLTAGLVLLIVSSATATDRAARGLAWVFVAGACLSILVGLIGLDPPTPDDALQTAQTTERTRLSGGSGDPNYLAAALVPAAVLLTGLVSRGATIGNAIAAPIAIFLTVGTLATASRGGLIAAAAAIMAALLLYRTRRVYVVMFVGLLLAFASSWLVANPDALERVTEFDGGGNGRTELWKVALRMSADHPLTGVGVNNFIVRSGEYVREPGQLEFVQLIAERPRVTHNAYLQMLAETGIVGLVLFLAMFAASIRAAVLATRSFVKQNRESMANLSRAATVALVANLVSSVFLSNGDQWLVWILFGFAASLLINARRGEPEFSGATAHA